jgi:hypothetical protein
VDDDCLAARLAAAYRHRFGRRAAIYAALRLTRALRRDQIVKTDLMIAVGVILRDESGQFRASRASHPAQATAAASIAVAAPPS